VTTISQTPRNERGQQATAAARTMIPSEQNRHEKTKKVRKDPLKAVKAATNPPRNPRHQSP